MNLSTLNKEQKAAVLSEDGALLILAGAGSGKTRVLTSKIAYLIQQEKVAPWRILAFTFTNKAAEEMKSRVAAELQQSVDAMWIGTFHSICSRILRRDIDRLGFENNFTIYDSADQKTLVKRIMKDLNINDEGLTPGAALNRISDYKNKGYTWEALEQAAYYDRDKDIAHIYKRYETDKKKNNALDFDDLINKTIDLLHDHPDVAKRYKDQFDYVFVDEYQDTNHAQYQLILALSNKDSNVTVVGDADQSIYGWRGADINNILNFEKDFPNAKVIKLEQNYRSTQKILNAANRLIANNESRKEKNLWTDRHAGDDVSFKILNNEYEEAQQVVNWIQQEKYKGKRFDEMAILYRTNAQSRAFEEALIQEGVPYRVIGGLKFYDRAEIKDLIAYMTLAVNPTDDESFRRIVNQPKRGIGAVSVDRLQSLAEAYGLSLIDALREPEILKLLPKAQRDKFKVFTDLMDGLDETKDGSISAFIEQIYTESGYRKMLESSTAVEDMTRMENVDAFFNAIAQYEEDEEEASALLYLQNISLMSDLDKTEEGRSGVSLMTIHSAKGLEFPIVFLTGLEDGLFPSRMTMEEGQIEEERRLMYVAVTRAEDRLYMTQALHRRVFGQTMNQKTSRFIDEFEDTVAWEQPKATYEEYQMGVSFGGDSPVETKSYSNKNYQRRQGFANPEIRAQYDAQRERMRRLVTEKKEKQEETLKTPLRTGDKVEHRKFGVGTVVSVTANESGDELVVAFDSKGLKRLNGAIAPLKKIN